MLARADKMIKRAKKPLGLNCILHQRNLATHHIEVVQFNPAGAEEVFVAGIFGKY